MIRFEKGWNDAIPRCVACGTDRHKRKWRGLCIRCYPLIRKIERIDAGEYRCRGRYAGRLKFENDYIKKSAIKELQNLMDLEDPILNGATGQDIEGLLVTIAEAAGANADSIHCARYVFEGCVKSEDMSRVYEVILRIVESLPSRTARRMNARRPFRMQ